MVHGGREEWWQGMSEGFSKEEVKGDGREGVKSETGKECGGLVGKQGGSEGWTQPERREMLCHTIPFPCRLSSCLLHN